MTLFNRYIESVKSYLPERQRDDIVRELAEELRSQVADKEAELGRTLNEIEVAVILKNFGHPMVVAGRYLPRQHLIGPAVFPFYWYTLRQALWITVLVYSVIAVAIPLIARIVELADRHHE